MNPCEGNVFQIQRWSVNDGDGIRSTLFLKGCPLRCRWCANPESWNPRPEILYFADQCTACGRCVSSCDTGAAYRGGDGKSIQFDRTKCIGCDKCSSVCPSGARKPMGEIQSVDAVIEVLQRDMIFYQESGGGVTFSGGEPFAQPEFLRQLLESCERLGLDTAVETSGYFSWEQAADLFEYLDLVFVDIKHMDDTIHRQMTGVSNQRILENIQRISRVHPRVIIRVPLIEEVNATGENIEQMCTFLQENTRVAGVELLPYHDFGQEKYEAVGAKSYRFTTPSTEKIEHLKKLITFHGLQNIDFK